MQEVFCRNSIQNKKKLLCVLPLLLDKMFSNKRKHTTPPDTHTHTYKLF